MRLPLEKSRRTYDHRAREALYFVSHATFAAVQNFPAVFPDVPIWHRGSVGSVHAVLSAHMVVHAAKSWL